MPTPEFLPSRQPADAATVTMIYVVALGAIPAAQVIRGIPLSITPATVIGLVMAMWWLCAHLSPASGIAKGANPVRTTLGCYLVGTFAGYSFGTYHYLPPDEVRLADHHLVLVVALVGAALLICDGLRDRRRLDTVLRWLVLVGAFVASVGALQFVLDLDLTRYLTLPILRPVVEQGFVFERADFRRVAATTASPIEFGVLCAMLLPLALHHGFAANAQRRGRALWWGCCAVIGSGLLFSVSRSAVLGVAVAGLVLCAGWSARRRVGAVLVTVTALALSRVAFPGLLGTILGLFTNFGADTSVQYRTHDYPIAAAEIAKSVWLGRGPGTFYAPKHVVFDNQYLLSFVEGGLVGLLTMIALYVVGMVTALRVLARHRTGEQRDLALALTAALAVPAVGSITFDLLSFEIVTGMLFTLLGAVGALYRISRAPVAPRPRPHPLPSRAGS